MTTWHDVLIAGAMGCLCATSAAAAEPAVGILDQREVDAHLIGPGPVVRTPWHDLTTYSGDGDWEFQLTVDTQGRVARATLKSGPDEGRDAARRAAEAVQFKPFERDGQAVRAQLDFFFVKHVLEDYIGPPDRRFPSHPDPEQVRIALQRTPCYGTCPDYWIEVRGDGQVTYRGSSFVVVESEHHWRIPPANVARLVELARKADYFHLDGYYVAHITDNPTFVTRVSIGGQEKFVLDYAGDFEPEPGSGSDAAPHMPKAVTEFENAIDEVTGARSWTLGDGQTLDKLRAEHWNFRSPAAGRGLATLVEDCRIGLALDFIGAGAPIQFIGMDSTETSTMAQAARCGHLGLVHLLESRGALARPRDAEAFLRASVDSGYPAFVEIALRHVPDARRVNADGTPLIVRATQAYPGQDRPSADATRDPAHVMSLLLAAGADPNARDRNGNAPLHGTDVAAAVRVLVAAGADPNARNQRGETPLFGRDTAEAVSALIEAGADLTARDEAGRTALFAQGDPEIAGVLIHAGADLHVTDREGQAPLETAQSEDVALMLLDAGATLPGDPARLSAMIDRATEHHWTKLLPVLVRAAGQHAG
jgi:hypothetical protein